MVHAPTRKALSAAVQPVLETLECRRLLSTTFLSDLNPVSAVSPYYGLQVDRAANGSPLQINGQTWEKGLGTHSRSEVVYQLNGEYHRFESWVGIDDFVGDGTKDGSAVFEVYGDGQLLASSSRLTGADDAEFLSVDVTGVKELRLVTTTGGDNDYKDHTNWADAKLIKNESNLAFVTIEATKPFAYEGGEAGEITITRHGGDISQPLTIRLLGIGGSATPNEDWLGHPGDWDVQIPAGETSLVIPIIAVDDDLVEGNETVGIRIGFNGMYNYDNDFAQVIIVDNDVPASSEVYLSDLEPVSAVSPYFGLQKDKSASGGPLTINGQTWEKGLGTHSASEVVYQLNGQYTHFQAYVGIDDFVGNGSKDGSAVFEVYGDGELLARSSYLTGADDAEFMSVDVTGVKELRLVTTTGGDSDYKDHTNWADAKLIKAGDQVVLPHLTMEVIEPIATDTQDAIVRITRTGEPGGSLLVRVAAGTPFSVFIPDGEAYVDVPIPATLFGASAELTVSIIPDSAAYVVDSNPVKVFYQPDTVLPTLSLEVINPTTTAAKNAIVRVTRTGDTDSMLAVRVNAGTTFTVFLNEGASFVDVPIPAHLFGANDELTVSLADSPSYVFDGNPVTVYYDRSATSDVVYLSDMEPVFVTSPYFGLQKDKSASGGPLTINGQTWEKGLGTHAYSEVRYVLAGNYTRFEAYVGIDDAVGNGSGDGSAVFEVWGDGKLLASSDRLTGADGAQHLSVDITNVDLLTLITRTGGDSDYKDHTNWADAKVFVENADQLPQVSITAVEPVATPDQPAIVRFERTGDTSELLVVTYLYTEAPLPRLVHFWPGESHVDVEIDASWFTGPDMLVWIVNSADYKVVDGAVTIYYSEPSTQPGEVYLSDWVPVSATSPYYGLKKDQAANGTPLEINGKTWEKGLGTHARSELVYDLDGQYTRFEAYVGIDDFVGDGAKDGSAVFEVYGDGQLLARSSRLTGADDAEFMSVDVTGVDQLRLVTTTGDDNDYKDHTNWADAKLVLSEFGRVLPHLHLEVIQPVATDSQDAIVRISRTGDLTGRVLVRVAAGTPFSAFIEAGKEYLDLPIPAYLFGGPELTVTIIPDSVAYIFEDEPVKVFYEPSNSAPQAVSLDNQGSGTASSLSSVFSDQPIVA